MSNQYQWSAPGLDLLEHEKTKVKPPAMYHVILNNDDYTPMDFVIEILNRFFSMDLESATQVMLKVHFDGKAICGTFTAEVAETKVMQVSMHAKQNDHPLLCTMEQV
ncbi:ATP-dependent Clp protease adapter ClpS [Vibrio sp. S11_S32]|uniref:ATP-dependent Clp protease adapter ClpS n=1 Tax=Vibrio sp. S11_S32 TaxID=2720225 RepID=UPI0016813CCC|nr:ATP-dependent Clp protease adapter ClpS [Vibrio sp. S11_S32]MBD1576739.1 ATP-dependent Clp protease adapter ClpS [Vibrio sp. S11_S32]